MKKWTPSQLEAIDTQGSSLLVSAAAGSGKTTALIERIIRKLTAVDSTADISRMLIVTFTRAAASELRSRIADALSSALADNPENKRLSKQLTALGGASICTIDSFYLEIVKSYFQSVKLPDGALLPSEFRIADESETAPIFSDIMEECIERFCSARSTEDAALFIDNFTSLRDDLSLVNVLSDIYKKVLSIPDGVNFIKKQADEFEALSAKTFFASKYGKVCAEKINDTLDFCITSLSKACEYIEDSEAATKAYMGAFMSDMEFCKYAKDSVTQALVTTDEPPHYDTLKRIFTNYSPARAGSLRSDKKTERSDMAKAIRDNVKKELSSIISRFFSYSSESIAFSANASAKLCRDLYLILSSFEKEYTLAKLDRRICDFGDIRRYAYSILINEDGLPSSAAHEISNRFDEIYIDEYQDVDEIQDRIFDAISTPTNRFMVGDIKQSIYGFRGAKPSLFASYRKSYRPVSSQITDDAFDAAGQTVFMSENFRCSENIIRFTNTVCGRLFTACGESIGYIPQDDLIFAGENSSEIFPVPVKIALIDSEAGDLDDTEANDNISVTENENVSASELSEATYVAAEIARLISEKKRANGDKIMPSDIAVLVRSKKHGCAISNELTALGIPVDNGTSTTFFENPEILMTVSLLSAINNPEDDISLMATMRSPLFAFTIDELALIRSFAQKHDSLYSAVCLYEGTDSEDSNALYTKCVAFKEKLSYYRDASDSMSVDKLLRAIYSDLAILSFSGYDDNGNNISDGRRRRQNLLRLYEYARSFESSSFKGLYSFINYINDVISSGATIDSSLSSSENAVKIMTVHQSKGLEFPICFFCGTGGRFNRDDIKDNVLIDADIGIGIKTLDRTGLATSESIFREAVAVKLSSSLSEEEIRILYVALTRAKERLYITSSIKNLDKMMLHAQLLQDIGTRNSLLACSSYIDWILSSVINSDKSFCEVVVPDAIPQSSLYSTEVNDSHAVPSDIYDIICERFDFAYPYATEVAIPAKLSVSKLSPDVLEPDEITPLNSKESFLSSIKQSSEPTDKEICAIREGFSEVQPKFISSEESTEASAEERGTATHLFMQFCDFKNAEGSGVEAEIARLVEKRFISADTASIINTEEIKRFFESSFYKSILKHASFVLREHRFNLLFPASQFVQDQDLKSLISEKKVLVQGVIDLYFELEDGRSYLCDYKTDRMPREAYKNQAIAQKILSERHSNQLSYYADAIKMMRGNYPTCICIYSTALGREVEIDFPKN